MKELLGEFGNSITYAIISVLCLVMLLIYGGFAVSDVDFVVKTSSYDSDSLDKTAVPTLTINNQVVIVDQNSDGYEQSEIAATLSSLGVFTASNSNSVKVDSDVNTAKEGTYNVKITASNDYGKCEENIAVVVNGPNHRY